MEILIIVDNKRIGGHSNIRDDEEWVAVFFVGNETDRAPWSSPLVYNSEAYWILGGIVQHFHSRHSRNNSCSRRSSITLRPTGYWWIVQYLHSRHSRNNSSDYKKKKLHYLYCNTLRMRGSHKHQSALRAAQLYVPSLAQSSRKSPIEMIP